MTGKDTCGIYQIYFYINLFKSSETSKILSNKKLDKNTIEKLINEVLTLDREENENIIESFAEKSNINRNKKNLSKFINLIYLNC